MTRRARIVGLLVAVIFTASLSGTAVCAPAAPPDSVPAPPVPIPADTTSMPLPSAAKHHAWALVLAGGAARGIAHIGVLRALEEEGIRPDLVCGTSMGALIGALYATGYTSGEIRDMIRHTDWDMIFGKTHERFQWRKTIVPEPWLTLVGDGLTLHLPSGIVDDSYLNFTLAQDFLRSEAMAGGDFDRLAIPFRCVGADAETTDPIVFKAGSVAHAVRASISIPLMFPAVPDSNMLLVDGGIASNMPVSTARLSSPDHILAIDVALPAVDLKEHSSMFEVAWSILDRMNKRSQEDTLSSRDRLVALKLPSYGPMDFADCDSLVEIGYREAREQIREFAKLVRATSDTTKHDSAHVVLPPVRPDIVWLDHLGRPSPREDMARRLFGAVKPGPLEPGNLRSGFEDVFRSDMFISAWPSFVVNGDSTTVSIRALSRPARELTLAAGYDNDVHARVNGTLELRPLAPRLPGKISLGATFDPLRRNVFFALEPHSLARGSNGWFLRGGWRETDVRLFDENRAVDETRVDRIETMAGAQVRWIQDYLVQAGAGYGYAKSDAVNPSGLIAAARMESGRNFGPSIRAVALGGKDSYATMEMRLSDETRTGPLRLRTTVLGGSSSRRTPPDELQALGGPETLAGLRRDEWLGHDRLAGEVRLLHGATSFANVFVYGQGGIITQSVSRPDLNGRPHFAIGTGFEAALPEGPLNLDWGIDDHGEFRLDVNFGQRF